MTEVETLRDTDAELDPLRSAERRGRDDTAAIDDAAAALAEDPRYTAWSLVEIRSMLERAVRNHCVAVPAAEHGRTGLLLWASVTEDIHRRLSGRDTIAEAMLLEEGDWRAGDIVWLLEVCCDEEGQRRRLIDAFARTISGRPLHVGEGIERSSIALPGFPAETPVWIKSWQESDGSIETARCRVREIRAEDADLVTAWLRSDRMRRVVATHSADWKVEEVRRLISTSGHRGQLLLGYARDTDAPLAGVYLVSPSEAPDVASLSLVTGDRQPLQQELAIDALCVVIDWLFGLRRIERLSARVLTSNRVAVNWCDRYWNRMNSTPVQVQPDLFVNSYQISESDWPEARRKIEIRRAGRPWNRLS